MRGDEHTGLAWSASGRGDEASSPGVAAALVVAAVVREWRDGEAEVRTAKV